jgi:hypothetical protein
LAVVADDRDVNGLEVFDERVSVDGLGIAEGHSVPVDLVKILHDVIEELDVLGPCFDRGQKLFSPFPIFQERVIGLVFIPSAGKPAEVVD